jgi:prepilin-type processing-associated H-X9-DG protein
LKTSNPLLGWQVDRASIRTIGRDLQRPECILAERDGTLWSADARGGVMRIAPDGTQRLIAQQVDNRFSQAATSEKYILKGTLPNGLAFARNGDILIANFGTNAIERMSRDGSSQTLLIGEALTAVNGLGWVSGTRDTLRNTSEIETFRRFNQTVGVAGQRSAEEIAKDPLHVGGFGSHHSGGLNVSFADGSSRFLSDQIDREVLRRLGNRADGEIVEPF